MNAIADLSRRSFLITVSAAGSLGGKTLQFSVPGIQPATSAAHRGAPTHISTAPAEISWPAVATVLPTRGRPELLREAVRRGKEVTVVVELKARFDEEANINWAEMLESIGAQVVYGVVGLKTHAKMLLVTRREGKAMRRYGHLSTGNYNPVTATLYEDIGLLTADPEIGADLIVMTSHSRGGLERLSLGSVTDYLIRDTHIPVLVVKPDVPLFDEASGVTSRIVVPLDGSEMAQEILPQVIALASASFGTPSAA